MEILELDLNWPVIIFMASDSPLANAMFALAASSASNILIRYDSYELQIILLS